MAWSGHARLVNGKVRLLARDSPPGRAAGLPLDDVVLAAADSGTRQLLGIIDVCFAGSDIFEALRTVANVFYEQHADGQPWAGMLASTRPGQYAVDGVFGRRFLELLEKGPKDEASQRFWATDSELVTGDAIGNAMQAVPMPALPDGTRPQQVVFTRVGVSADLLRNPLFGDLRLVTARNLGDEPAELIGRAGAVAVVRSWIDSGEPGLRVVTGPPASGKTAILRHVANTTIKGRISAYVDSRGRTPDQVRQALPREPSIVVVDGLDEAGEHSRAIADQVLTPLATTACVIVGTRDPLLDPAGLLDLDDPVHRTEAEKDLHAYVHRRLAEVLDPGETHRLTALVLGGAPTFLLAHRLTEHLRAGGGLTTSLRALLTTDLAALAPPGHRVPLPPGMTPGALARHLLATLAWSYGPGFPEQEWITVAAATAPAGMSIDRDDVVWLLDELGHLVTQDRAATYRLAHDSLTAEFGGGRRSVAVTIALLDRYRAALDSGVPADDPAYLWEFGWRHAVDAGDLGLTALHDLAVTAAALRSRVAQAEAARAAALRAAGRRTEVVPHAEAAVRLYAALPEQTHALATAYDSLGTACRDAGLPGRGASERAVELFRALRSADAASIADLAGALTNLAAAHPGYGPGRPIEPVRPGCGDGPVAESVQPGGGAGPVTGSVQPGGEVGPVTESVRPGGAGSATESVHSGDGTGPAIESVGLYRELAGRNPAYRTDVAMALTNLSLARRRAGESVRAFEAAREAVQLYRDAPGFEASLAGALIGLSASLRRLDRPAEALEAAAEAVRLSGPATGPNRAIALSALAEAQLTLGQPLEAVTAAREALLLFAAETEPSFRKLWAGVLTLFSAALLAAPEGSVVAAVPLIAGGADASLRAHRARTLGLFAPSAADPRTIAEQAARQAVDLLERSDDRAALGEALLQLAQCRLAGGDLEEAETLAVRAVRADDTRPAAWSALATVRRRAGRFRGATTAAREAVTLLRGSVDAEPGRRADLAAALANLAIAQRDAGRLDDAADAMEEAVQLRRRLARDRTGLRHLATALDGLATIYLSQPGRTADAAEEALERHRELDDPVEIEAALVRLAWARLQADEPAKALAAATEAGEAALPVAAQAHQALGDTETAERLWTRMTTEDPVQAMLERSTMAEDGDPRAAGWLATVARHADLDLDDTVLLHEEARRHRTPDPTAFDLAWADPAPDWLTVDPAMLDAATKWIATDDQDALSTLLTPGADLAVREALLPVAPADAAELLQLRATAATAGPAEAYRRVHVAELAERFAAASPTGKRTLLDRDRADLLAPGARGLDTLSDAVLELAERNAHGPVLDALDQPDPEAALMRLLAAAGDDLTLGPTAEALAAVATTADGRLTADFYRAVARAVAGLAPDAAALAGRPGPVSDLLRAGAAIAGRHPAVLTVMLALTGNDRET
jgi:tetratricopeptide (TPR) repeat protein